MEFALSQPKNGPIGKTRKANISIEPQASNVTSGFDLDNDHDLWILKVKSDLDLWPHTWPWPWILMVKFWNSCISEWEGRLTLHKGCGSRSFMTMTIWGPRSSVWIYLIVTGVTSDVGVLSTHLVLEDSVNYGSMPCSVFQTIISLHFIGSSSILWNITFIVCKVCRLRCPLTLAVFHTAHENAIHRHMHWCGGWGRNCKSHVLM